MSRMFVVEVQRRSPLWVGAVQGEGVFVQGRTLRDVEGSARAALLLAFGDEEYDVQMKVRTEQTDALAASRAQYERTLVEAARYLRASRVSWSDIRRVTRETPTKIRGLMESEVPDPVDDPAPSE